MLLILPLLPSPSILIIEAILTTTTFVTGATLTKTTFVTGAILYTWATLSTSPTDISLSTGVTPIIAVTLVTGPILFTWATLSPTDLTLLPSWISIQCPLAQKNSAFCEHFKGFKGPAGA